MRRVRAPQQLGKQRSDTEGSASCEYEYRNPGGSESNSETCNEKTTNNNIIGAFNKRNDPVRKPESKVARRRRQKKKN